MVRVGVGRVQVNHKIFHARSIYESALMRKAFM